MMFMNLNSKSTDTQAGSTPTIFTKFFKQESSKKPSQQVQIQIGEFMKVWSNRLVSNDNTISYERQNYASDKKNKVQQFFQNAKNQLKQTFTNTVYIPLTFYEFHMIDHLHKLFLSTQLKEITRYIAKQPFITNYLQILSFTKQVVSTENVQQKLKKYVINQLKSLIKTVKTSQFASNLQKKETLYTEAQTNIFLMIFAFKSLQKQYSPYVRRVIKRIFNQLSSDSFMNTMQTLRYLENQRPEIQAMLQMTQKQLTSANNRIMMKTFDKYGRKGTIPNIQLKKVSQDERRKVVTILVSGFLSQDQDKKSQWKNLLSCMPDSEVYGLDWESQEITNLMGFMAGTVGDLVFTKTTLDDKFNDNPFNSAFLVAQQSGKYLAHIVDELFPQQFINIIGYSLGAELIKQFVDTTIELNKGKNLQKIVLLGGVSDCNDFHEVLSKSPFPLSITNMYTANDSVLEILLKRCRKGIEPVGLKELVKSIMHQIDNTDVSKQISGHLAYMMNFGKIADMLQLSQE